MIFYAKDCTSKNTRYTLSEEESKHCIKVLRNKIGSKIELINGKGGQYSCRIIDDHHKKCVLEIISKQEHAAQKESVHIGMAIPKSSDRLEWFAEKATELGIHRLTLINCYNSEKRKFNEKRLQKIMIAALKQSKRFYLPIIEGPIKYEDFIEEHQKGYIGHCYPGEKIHAKTLVQCLPFLVGPEGDFSKEEIDVAINAGYTEVQLSENRLRTETAALTSVFYLCNLL